MKLGRTYIAPRIEKEKFFDGVECEKAEFSYLCGSCQHRVKHDLWSFLDDSGDWEKSLDESLVRDIKKKLKLPLNSGYRKSHEEGDPYIKSCECDSCGHKHLVYVGFYEFQPTRYFGTLQGVYEIII